MEEFVDYTADEVKLGLERECANRENAYYHWYREYTIEKVVKTDRRFVYKVAFSNFESFDVVDVVIFNDSYFEKALYGMKRRTNKSYFKLNRDRYGEVLTVKERLEDEVRIRLKDIIKYGSLWSVDMTFLSPTFKYKSYIQITPCVYPGVLSGTNLKLRGNIDKTIDMNEDELETWINKVCDEVEKYAREMLSVIESRNNFDSDIEDYVGFISIDKEMEE